MHYPMCLISTPRFISPSTWFEAICALRISLDYSSQNYFKSSSILALTSLPELTWMQSPHASVCSCNNKLLVHLQTELLMASKSMFEVTWSCPPSASLSAHKIILEVFMLTCKMMACTGISDRAELQSQCTSQSSVVIRLYVHVYTPLNTAYICIPRFTRLPLSAVLCVVLLRTTWSHIICTVLLDSIRDSYIHWCEYTLNIPCICWIQNIKKGAANVK